MKMTDMSREERPREKLMALGVSSLSNAELMAILLRTGFRGRNVLQIAQELLADYGGKLSAVSCLSADELCRRQGMGTAKAVTLSAAFELGRRGLTERHSEETVVTSSEAAACSMLGRLKGLDHEECWAMFLNRGNRIISRERISAGGMFSTVLDPRTIARLALEKRAAAVIIFHNHPSGSTSPGTSDISGTENLKKALETFEISLMDHIIIGNDNYFSFADNCITAFRDLAGTSSGTLSGGG